MHTYIYIEAMYRIIANWMFQCKIMQIKRCIFFALEIVFQHPAHRVDNKSSPNIVSIRLEIHTYVCAAMMMIVHDVYTQKDANCTLRERYTEWKQNTMFCVFVMRVCVFLYSSFFIWFCVIFFFFEVLLFLRSPHKLIATKPNPTERSSIGFFLYKRFSLSLYTHTVAYTAARAYIDTELETKAKR